jgi:hypothetical protein
MIDLIRAQVISPSVKISIRDFKRLNALGENRFIERKSLRSLDNINNFRRIVSKAVSAFANTEGGVVLLGVDDDGELEDGDNEDRRERMLDWLNVDVSDPVPDLSVKILETARGSARFCYAVVVPESSAAPHQAQDKIFYIRTDKSSIAASGQVVKSIFLRQRLCRMVVMIQLYSQPSNVSANVLVNCIGFTVSVIGERPAENLKICIPYKLAAAPEFTKPSYNIAASNRDYKMYRTPDDWVIRCDYVFPSENLEIGGELYLRDSNNINDLELRVYGTNIYSKSVRLTLSNLPNKGLMLKAISKDYDAEGSIVQTIEFQQGLAVEIKV